MKGILNDALPYYLDEGYWVEVWSTDREKWVRRSPFLSTYEKVCRSRDDIVEGLDIKSIIG